MQTTTREYVLDRVIYTEEQPCLEVHEAMNQKYGKLLELFYTKSVHWKNEKEWRMVTHNGGMAKKVPGAQIIQIIYGINTSDVTKEKITQLIERRIPTINMVMKRNYLLEIST